MRAYYAAKSNEQLERIKQSREISLGRNVASQEAFAHISLSPFKRGSYALDVIGEDTNEAWVLELEISDETRLEDDPSGEGALYEGEWKVSRAPIRIEQVVSIRHIPNVSEWEWGKENEKILGSEGEELRKESKKDPGERLR